MESWQRLRMTAGLMQLEVLLPLNSSLLPVLNTSIYGVSDMGGVGWVTFPPSGFRMAPIFQFATQQSTKFITFNCC